MKTPANLIPVESPDDDRLIEYCQLRESRLSGPMPGAPHGVFIAEGDKVVRLLVTRSGYRVRSLLVSARREALASEFAGLVGPDVPVYVARQAVMDRVVGFEIHRGVLASGVRGTNPAVEVVLGGARACLVLESLANHDNVGGLMRVAAALGGVDASGTPGCRVLMDAGTCDPLYRKAIRVSMGHALMVPFARLERWDAGLCALAGLGFTAVALTTDADAPAIEDIGPINRPALLLGAEGPGLKAATINMVRVRVRIPMSPGVDSLNVVTAGAIALNRLVRPGDGNRTVPVDVCKRG